MANRLTWTSWQACACWAFVRWDTTNSRGSDSGKLRWLSSERHSLDFKGKRLYQRWWWRAGVSTIINRCAIYWYSRGCALGFIPVLALAQETYSSTLTSENAMGTLPTCGEWAVNAMGILMLRRY